ncbi:Hepatocellular carcinoma-associated antigen 59 [Trichophyton rubrum]|nr:Hepatocellular carcinoma-associated antigen 59 [Trichophyton rubrum]
MDVDAPLFNPAKRRKFMRRRADDTRPEDEVEAKASTPTAPDTPASPAPDGVETDEMGVADILRLRKNKTRKGGIEFSTSRSSRSDALVPAAETTAEGRLKAEMAKRRHGTLPSENSDPTNPADGQNQSRQAAEHTSAANLQLPQRQPATLGKLHEIDLGPDSKLQNIARTEAATRNLAKGDSAAPEDEETVNKGKPTRSGRRRRNSEDIMRDRLVEEVLRESKLDVYEEPQSHPDEDDQAADDRIADQFRRDFLDAIHSRRRGARTRNTKTSKTDAPRGPKLGGSRSARAAMREQQNKAQK